MTDSSQFFYFKVVDQEKVSKIINKLSSSKAKDLYGLETALIRKHSSTLIKPITHLINLSITAGTFPQSLKTATIPSQLTKA